MSLLSCQDWQGTHGTMLNCTVLEGDTWPAGWLAGWQGTHVMTVSCGVLFDWLVADSPRDMKWQVNHVYVSPIMSGLARDTWHSVQLYSTGRGHMAGWLTCWLAGDSWLECELWGPFWLARSWQPRRHKVSHESYLCLSYHIRGGRVHMVQYSNSFMMRGGIYGKI